MQRILIIEDENDIADLISFNLIRHHFEVMHAADGIKGLEMATSSKPDLIILDLMMPGMNGLSLLKEIQKKKITRKIPVIILTARSQPEDKIAGLELGADDYMTKPFSPKELTLRVQNLLKRSTPPESGSELRCGPFLFQKNFLQLYIDDELVELTPTEFKLILYLSERANIPQKREHLLMDVMNYSGDVHSRTLDTHLKRLRKKLGEYAQYLVTERGVGYTLKLPQSD